MFCSNCGTQIPDNASFCANCGTAVKAAAPVAETPVVEEAVPVAAPVVEEAIPVAAPVAAPVVEEAAPVAAPVQEAQNVYAPAPTYTQPTYSAPTNAAPVANVDANSLLIKGILALALCELGIPGIILGSMAKKLAAQFMAANNGQVFGKAKIGSILGRIGFGFGIGFTVFWGIYFLIFVILLGSM